MKIFIFTTIYNLKALLKRILPNNFGIYIKRFHKNFIGSILYNLYSKSLPITHTINSILFVCSGNLCRSVFAEYYLKSTISEKSVNIASGGLDVNVGLEGRMPAETITIAQEYGLNLQGHFSKNISQIDWRNFDLILAMEFQQYKRLIHLYPEGRHKIALLKNFAKWPDSFFCNIDDPYGRTDNEFRRSFKKIAECIDRLRLLLSIDD